MGRTVVHLVVCTLPSCRLTICRSNGRLSLPSSYRTCTDCDSGMRYRTTVLFVFLIGLLSVGGGVGAGARVGVGAGLGVEGELGTAAS